MSSPGGSDQADQKAAWFATTFARVVANVEQVIRGKHDAVGLALVCLLAEGHLLVEDVPGTGKTSLAKALAGSMEGTWKRVQFTPDLLPSDVTGATVYVQSTGAFEFRQGPVFANVVLGDEINRASPKTQSALLEVMEEQQVTVDGHPYPVPRPFMVIATQNPVEHEGTYRLPEAQLDRFLMRISLGYLDPAAELDVLANHGRPATDGPAAMPATVGAVVSQAQVRTLVEIAAGTHVEPSVQSYLVGIVQATRNAQEIRLGVSTRGALALQRAARVRAASQGRSYVTPDDVKALAVPVLAHRLMLSPDAELRGSTGPGLIDRIVSSIAAPSRRAA
jgi:MoxR-like ATPase